MSGCQIEIRVAEPADAETIHAIDRESFPDSIKNRMSLRIWKRWLECAITSAASEVYVISIGGEIAGYAILITDEARYQEESRRSRPSAFAMAAGLLSRPSLFGLAVKKGTDRLKNYLRRDVVSLSQNRLTGAKRTWIECLAVSPRYRGRGLAKRMFLFLEARTSELGRHEIVSLVHKGNKPIISVHESLNYEIKGDRADNLYFAKSCGRSRLK